MVRHSPRALMVPGTIQLVCGTFHELSRFTQQGMGARLFSQLGKVKVVRKRARSDSTSVIPLPVQDGFLTITSPTHPLEAKGQHIRLV